MANRDVSRELATALCSGIRESTQHANSTGNLEIEEKRRRRTGMSLPLPRGFALVENEGLLKAARAPASPPPILLQEIITDLDICAIPSPLLNLPNSLQTNANETLMGIM